MPGIRQYLSVIKINFLTKPLSYTGDRYAIGLCLRTIFTLGSLSDASLAEARKMPNLIPMKQIKATGLPVSGKTSYLSHKQKAVIIIKFLINHGADLLLDQLPEAPQVDFIHQMAPIPPVDQSTLADVIVEFANALAIVDFFQTVWRGR